MDTFHLHFPLFCQIGVTNCPFTQKTTTQTAERMEGISKDDQGANCLFNPGIKKKNEMLAFTFAITISKLVKLIKQRSRVKPKVESESVHVNVSSSSSSSTAAEKGKKMEFSIKNAFRPVYLIFERLYLSLTISVHVIIRFSLSFSFSREHTRSHHHYFHPLHH